MVYKELTIIEPVLRALDEKGHITPTPIQKQSIVPAHANRNVLGLAQTGTGKKLVIAN